MALRCSAKSRCSSFPMLSPTKPAGGIMCHKQTCWYTTCYVVLINTTLFDLG
jgi:hypothetical protein